MKNNYLIYTLLIMFSTSVLAQEGFKKDDLFYKNLKNKLTYLEIDSARVFADSIAYTANKEYQFVKQEKDTVFNKVVFYYIENKNKISNNISNKDYFKVHFRRFFKGKNIDLEIEGELRYSFLFVQGSFLHLFPVWKKYFLPSATKEKSLKGILNNKIFSMKHKVEIDFKKDFSGIWTISNGSVMK